MRNAIELNVRETGRSCVVDFGEHDLLILHTTQFRQELSDLIEHSGAEVLTIDMSGVKAISSEVFGTLAWLLGHVTVRIANPSEIVREVLSATRLDEAIEIVESDAVPA
ncbi:MAG TPA: STAS domain-containing protein [Planctomycetaceae bacterium]|nr:STAS domain-containing protein [Planctomycetaceae bacterium]